MKWPGPSRPPSTLGLVVEGKALHLVERGAPKSGSEPAPGVTLPFDVTSGDPVELGRALKERLASLPSRTRRCVVGLPAEWVMSVASIEPDLPEADRQSFLSLEAEKGFPCDPGELQIVQSGATIDGIRFVTQFGLRTEQVVRLESILRAAGLRPASMTLTLASLIEAEDVGKLENGRLLVVQTGSSVSTAFTVAGELMQVRALDGNFDDPVSLARELRITLEDLPTAMRSRLGTIRILAPGTEAGRLASTLTGLPAFAAVRIESHDSTPAALPERLALRWLSERHRLPEFLPPRPSRWRQWVHRYNARRLGMIGAAAAAALLAIAGALAWQEYRSWSLRSEWNGMKDSVQALNAVQDRIREFRPWHDTSFTTLSTLKLVTEVFPETGAVTAKSIEIKGHSTVTVTGSTRENSALLSALDRLRQRPQVTNLKIEQIRGKSPAQFTFSFQLARSPSS